MSRKYHRGLAPRAFGWGVVCLLIFFFGSAISLAGTPDAAQGYDLRAARALFNALQPGAVPQTKDLPADLPQKLTVWDVEDDKRTYAVSFGTRGGDYDDRGYFKIVLNGTLSDAAAKGWKILTAKHEKTGAEVLWKRVERSAANRFTYVGVRRKIGNVILTFAQRRPFDEAANAAAREAIMHFEALLQQAKENKLLARLVIFQITAAGGERELDLAAEPLRFSVAPPGEFTELRLRAEVRDAQDKLIQGIERFSFQVAGRLESFITLQGATWDEATKRWYVRGRDMADVTLRLDPAEGRLVRTLYEPSKADKAEGGKAQPGIRLRVGVKLQKSTPAGRRPV